MRGRKKYQPNDDDFSVVEEMKEAGATEKEIAFALGISPTTFKKYKNVFSGSLKKGYEKRRSRLADLAEDALECLITPRYVQEVTEVIRDGNVVQKTMRERYIPPNTTAIIFALCNLDPENWQSINRIQPQMQFNDTPPKIEICFTKPRTQI